MSLTYPDAPVETDFPTPPRTITDRTERRIEIRTTGPDAIDALVQMYDGFDPEDRAQGVPPSGAGPIREWLEAVLATASLHIVAWHEDVPVGHVMLVADSDGSYEVAIFVDADYREAGIGTALMRTALGAARARGIDRVWLSVERWNDAAISLYRTLGFEDHGDGGFEREMTIRLGYSTDQTPAG